MCFKTPNAQVDPRKPARYPVAESYAEVRSSTSKDGVTKGGQTIAEQYQAELKNPNARPRIKADPAYRGPKL